MSSNISLAFLMILPKLTPFLPNFCFAFFENFGVFWLKNGQFLKDHQKRMEYVRWHHYVPEKLLQGFVEPVNGLIKINFWDYFSILEHSATGRSLMVVFWRNTLLKTFATSSNLKLAQVKVIKWQINDV